MQNFYNGISQNIWGLLDAAAGGVLMSRTVKEAKSIVERMTVGLSICGGVDDRTRDQLD